MAKKGLLIVFEGLDGSGKGTQLKLMQEYLQQENTADEVPQIKMFQEYRDSVYKKNQQFGMFTDYLQRQHLPFATYDFPQYYDNFWGAMVGRLLTGEFGEDINPYPRSIFYLLDQADACKQIRKDLRQGKIVICNRYITSSYIFQTGMFNTDEEKQKYITWLEEAGYQQLGIVKPDVVIALYVKPEIAQELIKKKDTRAYLKEVKDINEKNLTIQNNAAKQMLYFCKTRRNWHLIDCMKTESELKSQQEIATEIRELLHKYIGWLHSWRMFGKN